MKYEVHLTVEPRESLIAPIGMGKIVDLDLDTPYPNRQLMVGQTREWFYAEQAAIWAKALQGDLQDQGWIVKRRKVETPMMEGFAKYREAHWKIPLIGVKAAVELERFRYRYGFLLSYSRLSDVAYLSSRGYNSFRDADNYFNHLNERVQTDYPGTKVHFENVLEDTNEDLDKGWRA